jgi:hypothetical protein
VIGLYKTAAHHAVPQFGGPSWEKIVEAGEIEEEAREAEIEAKIRARLERIHKSNVGMSEALLD